jgi:hypothetical protein
MSTFDRKYSSVPAMVNARAVAVAGSTATLDRHVSVSYSGTGNLNVWTRGVLVSGGVVTSPVRTGICMVPKTPLWYKNEVVLGTSIWWCL